MGKKSDYIANKEEKEDPEIGLDWKPGQDGAAADPQAPKKLTIRKKVALILMLIKILFTTIALIWGFASSIKYGISAKNNYYLLVFTNPAGGSSKGTTTQQYVLITNNISSYDTTTSDSGVEQVYYDRSTMVNCRIYSAGQRAVLVTLQDDTITAIATSQFTVNPLKYNSTGFFQYELLTDGILVLVSLLLYGWVLVKDIIALVHKNRKYRGLTKPPARGDMYVDDTNTCSKRMGRLYNSIRDFLILLIIDLGFVDIYNTQLNTCITNIPPAMDLMARLVGQTDLTTSDFSDYNLQEGHENIWMNAISFSIITFLCIKLIQILSIVIPKCFKKQCCGRFASISNCIFEILLLVVISFLVVIMLIWRFNYLNWHNAGNAFSVSA